MSRFSVEIESLVLDGFDLSPSEGRHLARLAESALTRLLAQRGGPSFDASGSIKEVPVQELNLAPTASKRRLAEEIAQALFRALDRRS